MPNGFSIFELVIALTIMSILAMFAIPNYKFFLTQAESQTQLSELQRALALARSQAMLRGVKVTVCGASLDRKRCDEQWSNGVIVFTDENGQATITNQEQIIHVINNSNNTNTLHWRSSFHVNYLQIQPSGMTNGENGTFWYCASKASTPSWALIMSLAGRARVSESEAELKKLSCT